MVKEYIKKIKESGNGLLSILNNILEISRIESGKVMLEETPQETGNVLNSCIVMLNPEVARKHHVITVTKKIKHPYVYFDTTLMTEIVLNILGNAVKYTSNEGTIQCSLMQYPHENKDWIYQEITISDNGIGMSKEFLEHIFENFERERSTTLSDVNGT